jgi:L-2,4-diaminobutyric acid acetyltransferase
LRFREPAVEDGAAMWQVAKATGGLDMNSSYAYLMVGAYFADTSVVADDDGQIVGFISGFTVQARPDTLFVWQVGVHPDHHGRGIATRMLKALLDRPSASGKRYIETTVTPSNEASLALFNGIARRLETECKQSGEIGRDLFPGDDHEEELVFRIGPFDNPYAQ